MGELLPEKLPSCDISVALAQAKVYRRFIPIIDDALSADPSDIVVGLSVLHTVRIQRLAEGLAAFSTACLQEEVLWIARPVLELFASQCVLLFVPLKGAQTAEERAELYHAHASYSQQRFAKKHTKGVTSGTFSSRAEAESLAPTTRDPLHRWQPHESWHRLELSSALLKGFDARSKALGTEPLPALVENIPAMIDICNAGVHGSPFAGQSYISKERRIVDNRAHATLWSEFPSLLAHASLEMTAFTFGKHPLVQPMMASELSNVAMQPAFPTVYVSLH